MFPGCPPARPLPTACPTRLGRPSLAAHAHCVAQVVKQAGYHGSGMVGRAPAPRAGTCAGMRAGLRARTPPQAPPAPRRGPACAARH